METLGKEFGKHYDFLYRYSLFRTKDSILACDLVQETFAGAVKSMKNEKSRFRGEASIKTWLTKILKNKIRDHYRKKPQATIFYPIDPITGIVKKGNLYECKGDCYDCKKGSCLELVGEDSPFDATFVKETLDDLENTLPLMTEKDRETFLLCIKGYLPREIAKIQGITNKTASRRINTARQKLRDFLLEEY